LRTVMIGYVGHTVLDFSERSDEQGSLVRNFYSYFT
jgi:hypothetical protein